MVFMELARLPSHEVTKPTNIQLAKERLAMYLAFEGDKHEAIAKLSKGDKVKAKQWRKRLVRWAQDPEFVTLMAQATQAIVVLDSPQIVEALVRRAKKGNIPAVKLALEVAGVYSPRSQVDHTGEIKVTVTSNRPPKVEDDGPIVDAEVVE